MLLAKVLPFPVPSMEAWSPYVQSLRRTPAADPHKSTHRSDTNRYSRTAVLERLRIHNVALLARRAFDDTLASLPGGDFHRTQRISQHCPDRGIRVASWTVLVAGGIRVSPSVLARMRR